MPGFRTLERLTDACRDHGIKLTVQRTAICQAIANDQGHPSANQIYEQVSRDHQRISLATVYRTVKTLRDAGILEEHTFGEDRCRYELADGSHHDHLIDAETGAIVEFCDPEIERLQEQLAARLGYCLTGHKLELYGVRVRPPQQ